MLSISQSRFRTSLQAIFLGMNALGIVLGVAYNRKTPDLYSDEKHGLLGWLSTFVALVWFACGLLLTYLGEKRKMQPKEPICTPDSHGLQLPLLSYEPERTSYEYRNLDDDTEEVETVSYIEKEQNRLPLVIRRLSSSKFLLGLLATIATINDRVILLFGFPCIATGVAVYGGMFVRIPNPASLSTLPLEYSLHLARA